jgi:V/A-type H+-transporting ATPase subunit F
MYKIAVMGDRDSIYGFAAVGLEPFPTDENAGAAHKLHELAENGYAVIYMTEHLYTFLSAEIEKYSESVLPAIIPIPGASGGTGLGVARVKKSVERAVGSDILFGGEKGGK